MEDPTITRSNRMQEVKGHAVAFLMLGIALAALYTHVLYFAIIPLLWMAFRIGKALGREQAHEDIERAAVARARNVPASETKPPVPRPASPTARLRQYLQH